ncbi:alpha-(1-_3)-arabinofuranosyltransferase domain-containing protein [Ornithinicoccus hortensis]|uniref:Arabinofuranan 3-O-arabinosyltransferase n=1 Tax=Ornithinicoccus hortensis TaxID=82346 RepID=A0A542YN15_9MICO|nr:alpha-(1->3)-arabinofuranosyltransferase family protein [Ornithinicoccus hortensis]TQL49496.1 arabinofuranan 3-O-arabinosyltransferase [Ornithinicoccus hortensis]
MTGERPAPGDERVTWRARVALAVLLLAALMFRQAPGLVVPDTKLDLTADPTGFLQRALHLWDPSASFGQLQNQAYGYLLPMGPFHALLTGIGLPAWVVQRLWWTLLAAVALVGVWKLAGALRMGTPWARYAAAFAYALSPRILSEVAVTSVEVWPMALAPWVLLPLVDPRPRSWFSRITRSALAVGLVGGVNAVASGAVLVLPALWFLTRPWTRQTLAAAAGWLGAVTVAMLWWLLPLLVLGGSSPPFLDWIESASTTTSTAAVSEALRGTTPWLAWLVTDAGASWPAGRQYVDSPLLIGASLALALAGLLALCSRATPHRLFLAVSVGTGLLLVTVGYAGVPDGLFADQVRALLDGPLAALRNTHKFELVVRLPLALLLAAALTRAAALVRDAGWPALLTPFLAGCTVVAVAAPAITAQLPRPEDYPAVAGHWREVADWLDAQPGPGSVLVVPAAPFADFAWGSTKDEPLQALLDRPFAVRDAVPLGGVGSTRWLDEVQRRLAAGDGDEGLTEALRRAGVGWVVVRDDLRQDVQTVPPVATHQALARAGLERTAQFGPPVGPVGESADYTVRERTIVPSPSVSVYAVPDPVDARLVPLSATATLDGGPEDVPALLAEQVAPDVGAFVLARDAADAPGLELPPGSGTVLADGYRRRAVNFGAAADNLSPVLADGDRTPDRPVSDYLLPGPDARRSLVWPEPVAGVTASSSASDADATVQHTVGQGPAAAVDGDGDTSWVSGRYAEAGGQWWRIDWTVEQALGGDPLAVRLGDPQFRGAPAALRVETAAGSAVTPVSASARPQELAVPAGPTTWLRIGVEEGDAGTANAFALAEVELPGGPVLPSLELAATGDGAPDVVALRAQQLGRSACLVLGQRPLCSLLQSQPAEEVHGLRRSLTLPVGGTYAVSGQVLPVEGDTLEQLLRTGDTVTATASSRDTGAAYGRPGAAVDGDVGSGWIAGRLDAEPTLTITLPEATELDGLRLEHDYFLAASRPQRLEVSLDGAAPLRLSLDDAGVVGWQEQEVRRIEIAFGAKHDVYSVDPTVAGSFRALPVGVSEIRFLHDGGLVEPPVLDPAAAVASDCGDGPTVTVGDTDLPTRIDGTVRQVLERDRLALVACPSAAAATLAAGTTTVVAPADDRWRPVALTLHRTDAPLPTTSSAPLDVVRPEPQLLSVDLPAREEPSLVVVPQNANAGWRATLEEAADAPLTPVTVEGWQQAYLVPAGPATTLRAEFGPDRAYTLGLRLGLVALGLLAILSWAVPAGHPVRVPPAARVGPVVGAGLLLAWGCLVAGVWGLLAGATVLVGVRGLRRLGIRPGVALGGLTVASGVLALALLAVWGPRPTETGVMAVLPQLLLLLAVVSALAGGRGRGCPGTRSPDPPGP